MTIPLLRDSSVGRKLTFVILSTCGLALLLAGVAIVTADSFLLRSALEKDLQALAQIVADNSTAALAFDNAQDAQQTLASLRARPNMQQACIYRANGTVLAKYAASDATSECPPKTERAPTRIDGMNLFLSRPILLNKEVVGTLYFRYQLGEISARTRLYSLLVGIIAICSMLLAVVLFSRMPRLISEPISKLVETAHAVSTNGDYGIRAAKTTGGELGILVDSFNEMLGHIQRGDADLRKAQDELEQRVAERTNELESVNKELQAFTYSVAHDLRAPLRHIDAFSRILSEEARGHLPPDCMKHLDRIVRATQQMGQLVDDLLNLSRVGRQEVRRQTTGLTSLVDEVRKEIKEVAVQSGSTRSVEWQIAKLPFVDCDPGLVKQVYANLLSNAVKYTRPRDRAIIEVGSMQSNGQPVFYVKDNGVGFSMKYANKLFGVFQRLHRQEDFEGTGVGLATVQRIIHKHGGKIWAEAELDKGAAFYFTLGLEEPDAKELLIAN